MSIRLIHSGLSILPSQQLSVKKKDDIGLNAHSTGSPHPQQLSHRAVSPLFSQTLPPDQRIRANEAAVDKLGSNLNVPPTAHPQQRSVSPFFSQRSAPSQQPRVNEDDFGANVRSTGSPHPQQFSQGTVSPSLSRALSPYQQIHEGAVDNSGNSVRFTGSGGTADDSSSTSEGRNSGFQVQTRPAGSSGGYSLQDLSPVGDDSSFSASVANALHEIFDDLPGTKISPWVNNHLYDNSEGTTTRLSSYSNNAGSGRSNRPVPVKALSINKKSSPSGLVNQWTNIEGNSTISSLSS